MPPRTTSDTSPVRSQGPPHRGWPDRRSHGGYHWSWWWSPWQQCRCCPTQLGGYCCGPLQDSPARWCSSSPSTRCWIICHHICRGGALAASASALRCPVGWCSRCLPPRVGKAHGGRHRRWPRCWARAHGRCAGNLRPASFPHRLYRHHRDARTACSRCSSSATPSRESGTSSPAPFWSRPSNRIRQAGSATAPGCSSAWPRPRRPHCGPG